MTPSATARIAGGRRLVRWLCLGVLLLAIGGCNSDGERSLVPPQDPPAQPPSGGTPPPPVQPPPPTGNVTLSWQAPTERADGSPLLDLSGFRIYYGNAADDLDSVIVLNNPGLSRYVVEGLTSGRWYFAMSAFDTVGLESARSAVVSTLIN